VDASPSRYPARRRAPAASGNTSRQPPRTVSPFAAPGSPPGRSNDARPLYPPGRPIWWFGSVCAFCTSTPDTSGSAMASLRTTAAASKGAAVVLEAEGSPTAGDPVDAVPALGPAVGVVGDGPLQAARVSTRQVSATAGARRMRPMLPAAGGQLVAQRAHVTREIGHHC